MSLADLCKGSSAVVQLAANTMGSMGGNSPAYADTTTTLDFLLQTASVEESLRFDARGERTIYNAFFATNPSLTNKNRLKVTKWMGDTLATYRYLRVLTDETEGRPTESMLWIVQCVEESLEMAS